MAHRAPDMRRTPASWPGLRLITTGSRHWTNSVLIWQTLDTEYTERDVSGPMVVRHGANPNGADRYVQEWCRVMPVVNDPHPANWLRLASRAGPARNAKMVKLGANRCLAFYQRGEANTGTDDCAGKAYRAGIPVVPYWNDEHPPLSFVAIVRQVGTEFHATLPTFGSVHAPRLPSLDRRARELIVLETGLPAYSFLLAMEVLGSELWSG